MTWTPITRDQIEFGQQIVLWIKTARAAGYSSMGGDWLPSSADFSKSALLERIRSGKKPLKYPPPRGLACPWYAVVEDAGPHYAMDVSLEMHKFWAEQCAKSGDTNEYLFLMQNAYIIEKKRGEKDFIVRDGHHGTDTGYRFRVWFDAEWRHPSGWKPDEGGWFIRHVDFVDKDVWAVPA